MPPARPTLSDLQHTLARERGFQGWRALKQALEDALARGPRRTRKALSWFILDSFCER